MNRKLMFNIISVIIVLTVIQCVEIIYIIWLIIFTVSLPVHILVAYCVEFVSQKLSIALLLFKISSYQAILWLWSAYQLSKEEDF